MTWATFIAQVNFHTSSTLGPLGQLTTKSSPTDPDREVEIITRYLSDLYSSSTVVAAMMDAVVSSATITIAKTTDNSSAYSGNVPFNFIGVNLDTIPLMYYFNNAGDLVEEDPHLAIAHEFLHFFRSYYTGADVNPSDTYLNGSDVDQAGPILEHSGSGLSGIDQREIALALGLTDHVQASYNAAGYSANARVSSLSTSEHYSDGHAVDNVRFGDASGATNNTIDHRNNTTLLRDLIFGFDGADTIYAGDGNDYVYGGKGKDTIDGGDGDDVLFGDNRTGYEGDNDTIHGGDGVDTIYGGVGTDQIYGDDDSIGDNLYGGRDADRFHAGDNDIIFDAENKDRLEIDNILVQGEKRRAPGSTDPFTDSAGNEFTLLNNGDLSITMAGTSTTVTVKHFQQHQLNITLVEPPPPGGHAANPLPAACSLASPLILDLDDDGLDLITLDDSNIYFSVDGGALARKTSWINADDGFLALDRNANGLIDNASELFGYNSTIPRYDPERTVLEGTSGFSLLAELDDNQNGVIDSGDAAYDDLVIWQDLDGNGQSDSTELFGLAESGIATIALWSTKTNVLQDGSLITDVGGFTRISGPDGVISDVWFAYNPTDSVSYDDSEISEVILALPDLPGSGEVADLHRAMASDATLTSMVEALSTTNAEDAPQFMRDVENVLYRWLGVDGVDPQSRGPNVDARQLEAIEAYYGYGFFQAGGITDPRKMAGAVISDGWQDMLHSLGLQLLVQTELGHELFPGVSYVASAYFDIESGTTLSSLIEALDENAPTDSGESYAYWLSMSGMLASIRENLGVSVEDFRDALDDAFTVADLSFSYSDLVSEDGAERARVITGGAGDDFLISPFSNNLATAYESIFVGGKGNDTLIGVGGNDAYLQQRDAGNDTIVEQINPSDHNIIQFTDDVEASDLSFAWGGISGHDLVITVDGGANPDSVVTVTDFWSGAVDRDGHLGLAIDEITFADDPALTGREIFDSLSSPTSGADMLIVNGTIDGLGGADTLLGDAGVDTYQFGIGSGQDRIFETEHDSVSTDTLSFKSGVETSDLVFSRINDDLIIRINETGDSVRLAGQFGIAATGGDAPIESFAFDGGPTLNWSDFADLMLAGNSSNQTLLGRDDADDTLDGGAGNDKLLGGGGEDTYVFDAGYGRDIIEDFSGDSTVHFGPGIDIGDLQVARGGATYGDLIIQIAGTGDRLTIANHFADWAGIGHVESFEFDGGPTLTRAEFEALIPPATGTRGSDELHGTSGDDFFDPSTGTDQMYDEAGNDTYVFGLGYGHDTIYDWAGADDVVQFAAGVEVSDVRFSIDWDLTAEIISTGDTLTIKRGFGPVDLIESFVFADGQILSLEDVYDTMRNGTSGDDTVTTSGLDWTYDLGAGNDRFIGNYWSADTYLFGAGDGNDIVSDVAVIQFKPDVELSDLIFRRGERSDEGGFNLVIGLDGTTDTLTIVDGIDVGGDMTFELADHTPIDFSDILSSAFAAQSSSGADAIYALDESAEEILDGGAGDDDLYASYSGPGDVFVFGDGYGHDRIHSENPDSIIRMASGVDTGDLSFSHNSFDLVITLGTDTLTVSDYFAPGYATVGSIEFDADPSLYFEDIAALFTSTGSGDDLAFGTLGADSISAGNGDDIVFAGDGADTLSGGDGADQLFGDAGVDIIDGGAGSDTVSGGDGDDTLMGGLGADTLRGDDGDDSLDGGDGSDYLDDYAGNNIFHGGAGNDVINGGGGDDTYLFGLGDGHDSIGDYYGSNVVVFGEGVSAEDLIFSWDDYASVVIAGTSDGFSFDAITFDEFQFDDLSTLSGDEIRQALVDAQATVGNDSIYGFAFDDVINGGAGDDIMRGDTGADTYVITPGGGHDRIEDTGYWGANVLDLTAFDVEDIALSTGGYDESQFENFDYDDVVIKILSTGQTITLVDGTRANGPIQAIQFADSVTWDESDLIDNVRLAAQSNSEGGYIFGTDGSETLSGGAGDDLIDMRGGQDTIAFNVGDGHDTVIGDYYGAITISFGSAILPADIRLSWTGDTPNDIIFSIAGEDDTLRIKERFEYLDLNVVFDNSTTWTFSDVLEHFNSPTSGNDRLLGTTLGDVLDGGTGNDLLNGQAGADEYVFALGYGNDTVVELSDGSGPDANAEFQNDFVTFTDINSDDVSYLRNGVNLDDLVISVAGSDDTLTIRHFFSPVGGQWETPSNEDPLYGIDEFHFADSMIVLREDIFALPVTVDSSADNVIYGSHDGQVLAGGLGDDEIHGGYGDDQYLMNLGDGSDTIADLGGDDTLVFGEGISLAGLSLSRPEGEDGPSNDLVLQVDGADGITVKLVDQLSSESGSRVETFQFDDGSSVNWQDLQARLLDQSTTFGDDNVRGFDSDDVLNGKSGDDRLDGWYGNDTLIGGAGDDTFAYTGGHDTINDFKADDDADLIEFSIDVFATFDDVIAAGAQVGDDVLVTIDTDNSLLIKDTLVGSLSHDDFRFV